jgi:hypothetical protein
MKLGFYGATSMTAALQMEIIVKTSRENHGMILETSHL